MRALTRIAALLTCLAFGCASAPKMVPLSSGYDQPVPMKAGAVVPADGVWMSTDVAAREHEFNVRWQVCCENSQAQLRKQGTDYSPALLLGVGGGGVVLGIIAGFFLAKKLEPAQPGAQP